MTRAKSPQSMFEGVDPWKSRDLIFRRRNLPHLEVAGATYFVSFRCRPGVQLPAAARDLLMASIRGLDGESVELDAAVVMPNHVHAIFRLFGDETLSDVLKRIKGRSAREFNRLLGRQGSVWVRESFDHIVRHEGELEEKIEYIRQNPVKAGLAVRPDDYRWLFVRALAGQSEKTRRLKSAVLKD